MVRTIISLEPADKVWLDEEAKIERVSMTEVVRKAVHFYRLSLEARSQSDFVEILKKTSGSWQQEDGLEFQRKIRGEWDNEEWNK